MADDPELKAGYKRLIRRWLILVNIPLIVLGAGVVCGWIRSAAFWLEPRNGPFLIVFFVALVACIVVELYWLFLRGGASELAKHPGLFHWSGIGSVNDIDFYILGNVFLALWALSVIVSVA